MSPTSPRSVAERRAQWVASVLEECPLPLDVEQRFLVQPPSVDMPRGEWSRASEAWRRRRQMAASRFVGANDEQLANNVSKRTRWLHFQLSRFPLPEDVECVVNVEPLDAQDTSVSKRQWERLSSDWLRRRMSAFRSLAQ